MKPTIARIALALFLLFSLTRCEKDDAALGKAAETARDAKTTIKTISGADVPHILDYIDAVAGKDGRVELYPQDDTRSQEDLLVGDIISDKIVVTDRSGLSNYTMKVEKLNFGGTFSVVNYIIKETSWGQYSYYMEYVPDFDWLSNDESNLDIEHFVGTITIYNSDGIFINEFYIANGKNFGRSELIDPCPDDGDGSGGGGNNDGEDPNPDTGDTGDSGDGDSGNCNTCPDPDEQDPCSWQLNVIDECVDHDPGGTCGGNTTEVVFVCEGFDNDRSVNTGDLLRTVCGPAPDECYDNQGDPCQFGCNGGECLPDPDDENPDVGVLFDIEEYIIANEIEDNINTINLDPCTKGVLDELKMLSQMDIAKILFKFGVPSSSYNWEIETAIPDNTVNIAETDWARDSNNNAIAYNYVTKIKPVYTSQATKIAIARTVLHELLHTYFISLIDDVGAPSGSNDITDFVLLWNAVVDQTYNNNPNQLHHEEIGRNFITPLKDALKEWDNAQQPDQYYEDLAWGALLNTSTFNTLFPIGSADRNRIININAAEDTNSTQNSISPKSNPC